jgi:hypothetical protein
MLPLTLLVVLAIFTSGDQKFFKSLSCTDHYPVRIRGEWERLVTASPVMRKSWTPAGGINYPENDLEKSPRRDT